MTLNNRGKNDTSERTIVPWTVNFKFTVMMMAVMAMMIVMVMIMMVMVMVIIVGPLFIGLSKIS